MRCAHNLNRINKVYFKHLTMLRLALFLIPCFWAAVNGAEKKQMNECALDLPNLSFFAPLIFTLDGVLKPAFATARGSYQVILQSDEEVLLSCSPNFFKKLPAQQFLKAKCSGGQEIIVGDDVLKFRKSLECEVRAIEEILTPVHGCPADLTSIEYGFTNPASNKSYVLGEACYDETVGTTRFVHSTFKVNYDNADLDTVALRIGDVGHFTQEHPLSRFKLDFLLASRMDALQERLTKQFGDNMVPQLVQDRFITGDMLLNYQLYNVQKLGWNYVMLNGIEVSGSVAAAMSQALKSVVSAKAVEYYVGTHGVLTVDGKVGGKSSVYLKDDKYPVAKYLWFVLRNGNRAVAYVVLNKAEGNVGAEAVELCENRCSAPIYCCEYKAFQNKVSEMPLLDGTFDLLL